MIELLLELLKITDSKDEGVQLLKGKYKLPETIKEYKRLKQWQ